MVPVGGVRGDLHRGNYLVPRLRTPLVVGPVLASVLSDTGVQQFLNILDLSARDLNTLAYNKF
jgi:hypothetical protein